MKTHWLGLAAIGAVTCLSMAIPPLTDSAWLLPAWCGAILFSRIRIGTTIPGWIGGGLGYAAQACAPLDLSVVLTAGIFTAECLAAEVAGRGQRTTRLWGYGLVAGLGVGFLHGIHDPLSLLTPAALMLACPVAARILSDQAGRPVVEGRTLLATVCGYLTYGCCCVAIVPLAPLAAFASARQRRITSIMRCGMRLVYACTPGTRWTGTGQLTALAAAPIVIANHESVLDILSSCCLPGERRVMLAKPWVFKTPLLGWAARASGMRSVSITTADEFLHPETARFTGTLVIFPEGSRSPTGALQRFRPGAFVLARALACPLVPVVHVGGRSGIIPGSYWIRPTPLISHVLPPQPLPPSGSNREIGDHFKDLIARTRRSIVRELVLTDRFHRRLMLHRVGLAPLIRRRMTAEYRCGDWKHVIEAIPAAAHDEGHWLLFGTGWSVIPAILRLLLPGVSFIVVEPDACKLACARAAWAVPGRDLLASEIPPELPLLSGCVLLQPPSAPCTSRILHALSPTTVVVTASAVAAYWKSQQQSDELHVHMPQA